MNAQLARVRKRRRELLEELAKLEEMRRGSLCSQLFEATRKDGTKVYRGPYALYTYKEKGKTLSRRITKPEDLRRYREQIDAFRRFQALSTELVRVGERISDLVLSDEEELKKNEADAEKNEALGIEHTVFTPGAQRMMAKAASRSTFAQAAEDLALYANLRLTSKTIERCA